MAPQKSHKIALWKITAAREAGRCRTYGPRSHRASERPDRRRLPDRSYGKDNIPADPAYIRNFKAFAKSEVTVADLPKLEAEMHGSNDRATAVLMAAITDACLETFLRLNTRPSLGVDDISKLFDYRGPLGDFSSKILVAYAFNMVGPETRHDLDLIRMLRNEWAHSRRSFGFDTKEVAEVCKKLISPDWQGAAIPYGPINVELGHPWPDMSNSRTRYMTACHTISSRLLLIAGGTPSGAATPDLR
jgi:hypothetical protein